MVIAIPPRLQTVLLAKQAEIQAMVTAFVLANTSIPIGTAGLLSMDCSTLTFPDPEPTQEAANG